MRPVNEAPFPSVRSRGRLITCMNVSGELRLLDCEVFPCVWRFLSGLKRNLEIFSYQGSVLPSKGRFVPVISLG